MWERRMRKLVLLFLLGALLSTALTGLLTDILGRERSLFHRFSSYSLISLILLHLYLYRRTFLSLFSPAWKRAMGTRPPEASLLDTRRLNWSRRAFLFSSAGAVGGFILGRWLPLGKPPPLVGEEDLGKLYHQWSKPGPLSFLRRPPEWGLPPPLYKTYPKASAFHLPTDFGYRGLAVEEAIQLRRSIRDYSSRSIPLGKLSHLLHLASGITEQRDSLRAAPSAGALYPIEIYPMLLRVEGLTPGVYHYEIKEHNLRLLRQGDFRLPLFLYCVGQELVLGAGAIIALSGIFQRTRWKYEERHYRYVLLEAGHIGQNIYLAATSLGLGTCAIGAFLDDELNRLLGLDGREEATLYLLALGTI